MGDPQIEVDDGKNKEIIKIKFLYNFSTFRNEINDHLYHHIDEDSELNENLLNKQIDRFKIP